MSLRKHKTHHVGFRLTELEHSQLAALAEEQGVSPGECCRAVLQESLREKTIPIFGKTVLEELAALRGIVSTLMFDLVNGSSLTEARMNQIIAHAEQSKLERAACIIRQALESPARYRPSVNESVVGNQITTMKS